MNRKVFVYGANSHFVITLYYDLVPFHYDLLNSWVCNMNSFLIKQNYQLIMPGNDTTLYKFDPYAHVLIGTPEDFKEYCAEMKEIFENELEDDELGFEVDEEFMWDSYQDELICDNTIEQYINNKPVVAVDSNNFGVAIENNDYDLLLKKSGQPASTFIANLYEPLTHNITVPYVYKDKNGEYCYYDHLGYELVKLGDINGDIVMAEMINEDPVLAFDMNKLGVPISDEMYYELTGEIINHENVKRMIKIKKEN